MREIIITKKVYTFDELSDEAKTKVTNNIGYHESEFVCDEYYDALKAMEQMFHIKVYNYDVDEFTYCYSFKFTIDIDDNYPLLRYLNNYIFPSFGKGKYYSKYIKGDYKYRRSRIIKDNCCALTGTYCDYAAEKSVDNAFDYVRNKYDVHDFIDNMLDNFFSTWRKDIAYMYSEEIVKEYIDDNNLEFFEDGTIYGTN